MLASIFILTLIVCFAPLLAGALGVILPAFSWLPALGFQQLNGSAFAQVAAWPNLGSAIGLSLFTGLGSSLLALIFTYWILSRYWLSARWQYLERCLSPLLALPHVALAIGLSLLLAPSAWIYRLAEAFGIDTTNSVSLIQDPYGFSLLLMLAIKETPFLIIMSIPVLRQLRCKEYLAVAHSLGYSSKQAWLKVMLPLWLPKIRLPLFAIVAYGLSVVDVALIIGPTRPAPFAVIVWQWFNESNLQLLPQAAAGALLLLVLTAASLLVLRITESLGLSYYKQWQVAGACHKRLKEKASTPWLVSQLLLGLPIIVLLLLTLWSIAKRWRFPDLSPSQYSGRFWLQELPNLSSLLSTSLSLALASSALALLLAIGCLEFRHKYRWGLPLWLLALPLITPQLSLLFGLQVASYWLPGQHYYAGVLWSHILFVFPYIYLALDGTWRSYDLRLEQCSLSLGKTQWQTWWQVKRPQVQAAVIFGFAIGLSVSLAQYLPTQMLGAGRITTLTTEAVTLTSGQDRRIMAIYGLLQGCLPLIFFTAALSTQRLIDSYRRYRRELIDVRSRRRYVAGSNTNQH